MHDLKIKRAFHLFDGSAFNSMGINHGSSHIAMAEQLLNGANIIIGLQQMTDETVTKGVRSNSFGDLCGFYCPTQSLLDPGCMNMISFSFTGFRYKC